MRDVENKTESSPVNQNKRKTTAVRHKKKILLLAQYRLHPNLPQQIKNNQALMNKTSRITRFCATK
jgi:hypothetical protein